MLLSDPKEYIRTVQGIIIEVLYLVMIASHDAGLLHSPQYYKQVLHQENGIEAMKL